MRRSRGALAFLSQASLATRGPGERMLENAMAGHKGWHSRGYLPHLDVAGEIQALTFRLADALPTKVVEGLKMELAREGMESIWIIWRTRGPISGTTR